MKSLRVPLQAGRLRERRACNRRIGEFLKELRLTEGRGTGIPKVIRAMQQNGSPPPRFDTNEERDYFTAILPIHPALLGHDVVGGLGNDLGNKIPKSLPKPALPEREVRVLEFCRAPRSRVEIQRFVGSKSPKTLRQNYLWPLLNRGLLEMTVPAIPTSSLQKYRTTAQVIALLAGDN